jgi:hypothetical protein
MHVSEHVSVQEFCYPRVLPAAASDKRTHTLLHTLSFTITHVYAHVHLRTRNVTFIHNHSHTPTQTHNHAHTHTHPTHTRQSHTHDAPNTHRCTPWHARRPCVRVSSFFVHLFRRCQRVYLLNESQDLSRCVVFMKCFRVCVCVCTDVCLYDLMCVCVTLNESQDLSRCLVLMQCFSVCMCVCVSVY